jgi:hypothetical protein
MNRSFLVRALAILAVGLHLMIESAVAQTDAPAEASAESEVDVAKLTPEKLAEQFSVEWTNISASAQRVLKQDHTQRTINISGQITLVKEENILLLSSGAEVSEAIDDTGRVLVKLDAEQRDEARRFNHRHFSFPHRLPNQAPWFGKLNPSHVSVNIPDVAGKFPAKLSKVTANFYVLVGKTTPKELRLEKSDEWTELAKGLSVRFKKCDVKESNVQYELEGKGDEAAKHFHGFVDPRQGLPKVFILKAAFLDENGAEHEVGSHGFSVNTSGSAGFGNVGELLRLRFYVATDIREVAVPLKIENLEVPTLADKEAAK